MLSNGLDCGVDHDGLLFLFCMRLWNLRLCAFCVMTDAFAFLYVDEFLFAACGVSPMRGRPAIAQAPRGLPKGWTPTLFSLGAGLWFGALESYKIMAHGHIRWTNAPIPTL